MHTAATDGVRQAITDRDGPFGDYSPGPKADQPGKRE
jgi:hypothetical protein